MCIEEGCKISPIFNYEGEKESIYCSLHKLQGMVNVKNKICETSGCKTQASYGYLFESKTKCFKHKSANQFLKYNPKCSHIGCKNRPFYTNDNTSYPKRCDDHKIESDINIVEKECTSCNLKYFIPTNREKCDDCDGFIEKKKHIKEENIKLLFESNGINFDYHDKIIQDATRCSARRPDFIIDKGTFKVIVEVDEYQHSSYERECEITRMKQIYFDLGGYNVVFIRYNPDKFVDNLGNKGKTTKLLREKLLCETILSFDRVENIENPIEVYYLFYDGFDGMVKKQIITPY